LTVFSLQLTVQRQKAESRREKAES
jgi:hypothetical protein